MAGRPKGRYNLRVAPNLPETEWAYLAGIVDGEGSILLRTQQKHGRTYYAVRLHIPSTTAALMDWLVARLGGPVCWGRPKPPRRAVHTWTVSGKYATMLLARLRPYLVIKQQHAELVIQFQERCQLGRNQWNSLSVEELAYRNEIYSELKVLNKRGIPV